MLTRLITYCRQFPPILWIATFGWFAGAMGFGASIPFVSVYFAKAYGMSYSEIGLVFGILAIVRAGFQALGGELYDRHGPRLVLVLAQGARSVTFLAIGVMIAFDLPFVWVFVTLLANFVFGALFLPAVMAMVGDFAPPGKRMESFAIGRSAGNLGWAVGPMIGGLLAEYDYSFLFYASALFSGASAIIFGIFLRRNRELAAPPSRDKFRLADIWAIRKETTFAVHALLTLALYIVVAQMMAPFALHAVDTVGISEQELGFLYAVNGVLVAVLQIPVTRYLRGMKLTSQLALGATLYFIGFALVGWFSSYWVLVLLFAVVTIGEVAKSPASLTITSRLAPEGQSGRYMGIYGFFVTAGFSIGPLYGGLWLDWLSGSPRLAWIVIASTALIGLVGYLVLARRLAAPLNRFDERASE